MSDIGQQIMEDVIIAGHLVRASCAEDESHDCVMVWSANAAEQIGEFVRSWALRPSARDGAPPLADLEALIAVWTSEDDFLSTWEMANLINLLIAERAKWMEQKGAAEARASDHGEEQKPIGGSNHVQEST